jgi:3-phosphoshikimate 1-carboxyvinyltransferase
VKSAILLAGLYADGTTVVHQPGPARDHTELMLRAMAPDGTLMISGLSVSLTPPSSALAPLDLTVPGDISSACFPLVASLLVPGSEVTTRSVGVNPTRTGLLDVLRSMGADLAVDQRSDQGGEPVADVTARSSSLTGTEVSGDTVVRMIDEFPLLAVAATQAQGTTVVRDAAELRVKETDRIAVIASELRKMGARIAPRPDGFVVVGPTPLQGATVNSHGDHRIAMALAIAGLMADGETLLENPACIRDSFPGFTDIMVELGATIV